MTREAGFASRCAVCDETIEVGDQIVRTADGEWVHEACDEDEDPRDLRFNLTEEARDGGT